MLDPTNPDVAAVLDLLDECDVPGCCDGVVFEERAWCQGTGKALHPDRVVGALRRAMKGRMIVEQYPDPDMRTTIDVEYAGGIYTAFAEHGDETSLALAFCRAARAVREGTDD